MLVRTLALMLCGAALSLRAQAPAVLSGSVLTDSTELAIADAEVAIPTLKLSTRTTEGGAFRLTNISPGTHLVMVRRVGYAPISAAITFAAGQEVETEFLLIPRVVELDTVSVAAKTPVAKMRGFEERRAMGFGHFLDRIALEKHDNWRMSELIAQIPGTQIMRGRGGGGFVTNGRGVATITNSRAGDRRIGIPPACYANVYLDGVQVYAGRPGQQHFDVNQFGPNQLEAVEYYAGGAQMPTQYGGPEAACGVLLLWTRVSR